MADVCLDETLSARLHVNLCPQSSTSTALEELDGSWSEPTFGNLKRPCRWIRLTCCSSGFLSVAHLDDDPRCDSQNPISNLPRNMCLLHAFAATRRKHRQATWARMMIKDESRFVSNLPSSNNLYCGAILDDIGGTSYKVPGMFSPTCCCGVADVTVSRLLR